MNKFISKYGYLLAAFALAVSTFSASLHIPVHPDRYSGNYTDSVPEVSGHESDGMRTVIRRYPDTRRHL